MADKKTTLNLICENCDSEFTIKFSKVTVAGNPSCCAFCGEDIESGNEDDFDDEDDVKSDDDY